MNILGVGPLELVIILVLGLIVLGPERLPEAGRSLGRLLAKVLAWQQQSPEVQMIQDIRQEFEGEIYALRDELVRTRRQLDVSSELRELKSQTSTLLKLTNDQVPPPSPESLPSALPTTVKPQTLTIKPATGIMPIGSTSSTAVVQDVALDAASNGEGASDDDHVEAPPRGRRSLLDMERDGSLPPYDINDSPLINPPDMEIPEPVLGEEQQSTDPPTTPDHAQLAIELRQLALDVRALRDQLRARGLIDL